MTVLSNYMHIDWYKFAKNKVIFIKTGYGTKLVITRYDHEKNTGIRNTKLFALSVTKIVDI